jgi:hypothetical protein
VRVLGVESIRDVIIAIKRYNARMN